MTVAGCSASSDEPVDKHDDAVVQVPTTPVLNQGATGSCWLYATAAWAESLHASRATSPQPRQFSPAYWVYWTWLDALVESDAPTLGYGGTWGEAVEIIEKRGLVALGGFVQDEAGDVASAKSELEASVKSGALRSAAARGNRRVVRDALDRAFKLSPATKSEMTRLFGEDLDRPLAKRPTSTRVWSAHDLPVLLPRRDAPSVEGTLADAIGTRDPTRDAAGYRVGPFAWTWMGFPDKSDAGAVRDFYRRVQRTLHAGVPLPNTWLYLPPAYEKGKLRTTPAKVDARQGEWHVTLIVDYEIDGVPGFGRLAAGTKADEAQMKAALAESASVVFLRVKNSWGEVPGAGPPGHTDLYRDYIEGTTSLCERDTCETVSPLIGGVTLPVGF